MHEFAHYFGTTEYLHQAAEKLEPVVGNGSSSVPLWHVYCLTHFFLAEHEGDANHLTKAMEGCERAAQLPGFTADFCHDWGLVLMKQSEFEDSAEPLEEALKKFEWAIEQRGGMPDIYFDEDDEAVETEGPFCSDGVWLYNYACALDLSGDLLEYHDNYERAAEVFRMALELDGDEPEVLFALGLALSHLGEVDSDRDNMREAIELFKRVIEHDREDAQAWTELGVAYLNLSKELYPDVQAVIDAEAEVEEKLLQAVALGSTTAFYHLGCYYALVGNHATALDFLERAYAAETLPPAEDLLLDEWLDPLQELEEFQLFLSKLEDE